MSAPWLADILADEFRGDPGFRVDAVTGWERRSARTTFFQPEGVMNHHTGPGSYNALLSYMATNASTAPLCNYATSRPDNNIARITVVAAGRANHAGRGELSWRRGQGSTGNAYSIGGEHQNNGSQSWPSQQLEAIYRSNAAILQHLKQGTSRLTDHKTYALPSGRKSDPHSLSLASQRNVVNALLKVRNAPPPPPPVLPPPVLPTEEEEMRFLVNIEGSTTAYEVIDDPDAPGKYALRPVPGPNLATAISADTGWRNNLVTITSTEASRVRILK